MFSGIVEKTGIIERLDLQEKWGRIVVQAGEWPGAPVQKGDSVAVQGICLTTVEAENGRLVFDVLKETFDKTNLGEKKTGAQLNLERSLRWGQTMGGHIVVGHVDGIGRVRTITPVGRDWKVEIACAPEIMAGMVYKGSAAVDGISLTVAEAKDDAILVHIIPYTWTETTFSDLREGAAVNLEVDLLAKYARKLLESGVMPVDVTWEKLRKSGLLA